MDKWRVSSCRLRVPRGLANQIDTAAPGLQRLISPPQVTTDSRGFMMGPLPTVMRYLGQGQVEAISAKRASYGMCRILAGCAVI
jgi:hypothetical protein